MDECNKEYKYIRFLIPATLIVQPLLVVVVQLGNNYNIPFHFSRYMFMLLFILAQIRTILSLNRKRNRLFSLLTIPLRLPFHF